nr:RNA-directed DNA polymerase, eukaryota [Tanacetum cinerariifolium]
MISKSIFITNFPDSTTSSDLCNLLQVYGTVVDVYIPNRRTKAGKRFAFVRFIKVDNVDRLVGNLCTLWIGRMHLHANVVRFEPVKVFSVAPLSASPAMVLDDSCMVTRDLGNYVMGEVKQFSSINNLHVLFSNEGFYNVQLVYLGGLWVMIELNSSKSKAKFLNHVGVASWFNCLSNAQSDFISRDRIVWVDIEGVPMHAWSRNTFCKIGSKWGEVLELEECRDDFFARKRICIKSKQEDNILEKFKIIVKGKIFVVRAKELFVWSSTFKDVPEMVYCSDDDSVKEMGVNQTEFSKQTNLEDESDSEAVSNTYFGDNTYILGNVADSVQPPIEKEISNDPFNIYDLLNKRNKEVDKTGTDSSIPFPPGFTPVKDIYKEAEQDMNVDQVRGSGFKHSEGGSILEILDEMIKVGQTMRFSMDGCTKDIKKIIGSQGVHETKMDSISTMEVKFLWGNSNFEHLFNEVLGNSGGARAFNNFITNSGLVDVQLEGYTFTWAHPSATKMSKLDCFLVTDGLLSLFPYVSAVCLDGHLSDHRPILLREVITDYGATPFCLYHSWFSLHGFEHMVTYTWNSTVLNDSNRMIRFKKKLQILKKEIRTWVADQKKKQSGCVNDIKSKLSDIDKTLYQGGVTDDLLLNCMECLKQFHDVKTADARIMIDGEWVDDPSRVKDEFRTHFVARFQDQGICHGCNSSFIALIPKSLDPKSMSDYRPISLIGSIYKVVTKILATRLLTIISDLISNVQTTFLSNRQILDGPFIINDLLTRCHHKKQRAMVFKFDFAKAYDSIRWDYFEDVLKSFGFGSKWWDPLAPYLFILIMESLHLSFSRVIDAGIFTGVRIDSSLMISHLFYADDAVFIASCVYEAAMSLGCSVMKAPFKYLGIMVGGNMSLVKAWDDTVDKLKGRLSNWKLKTFLSGVALLFLNRNFFNGIHDDERKVAWVKWSKVLVSKNQGGLGVSSFYALNRALLVKWVWRFLSHDNSLWARVIYAMHGSNRQELSASHSSSWSSILKDINILKAQGVDLISHCKIRVGNGLSTSFWNDLWVGDAHLRLAYEVMRLVYRWWNLVWIPLNSYPDWLSWFKSLRMSSNVKGVLEGVFYITWWSIWCFRNQFLFAAKKPLKESLFDDIVMRSFTWCIARGKCSFSRDSWLQHP